MEGRIGSGGPSWSPGNEMGSEIADPSVVTAVATLPTEAGFVASGPAALRASGTGVAPADDVMVQALHLAGEHTERLTELLAQKVSTSA